MAWQDAAAAHTLNSVAYDPDYTPCGGGVKTTWYACSVCGRQIDASGNDAVWYPPETQHTAGSALHPADYIPCQGGYQTPYYLCTVCGLPVDASGSSANYTAASVQHTPGTALCDPDYTVCGGGCKSAYYQCTACGLQVNADGWALRWYPPTAYHTLGTAHALDYTPCEGGFQTIWYECQTCDAFLNADGTQAEYTAGSGQHDLELIPQQDPTYQADGRRAYWNCKDCGQHFSDAAGTQPIADDSTLILPKLTQDNPTQVVSGALEEVPSGVSGQYGSTQAIQQAMFQAALLSAPTLSADGAACVLLDVELQVQLANGSWVPVTPEDFPAGGVEVTLAYPAGTNASNYTFVVTHMITHGANAGQIETLPVTLEADGIHVRFTSLSPVVITYQQAAAAPAPGGTPPAAASPETSDSADLLLWLGLVMLSAAGLLCLRPKKKAR